MRIDPYLNFEGNTEEAFNFYKKVFGNDFEFLQRFKETPDGGKMPAEEQEKLMHVSLPVGDSMMMATDITPSMGMQLNMGNNISLSVTVDSKEDADRIFKGLSEGGKAEMPMQDMFWGAYYGMLEDRFGIRWMVSYNYPR